jgi:hypothetical protein
MKKDLAAWRSCCLMLLVPWRGVCGSVSRVFRGWDGQGNRIQEPVLQTCDYSLLPQSVVDDAVKLAGEVKKEGGNIASDFADQLLAMYAEASKQDIVIIFNSGGLGWNLTTETPGWQSILEGMKDELEGFGYKTESSITGVPVKDSGVLSVK